MQREGLIQFFRTKGWNDALEACGGRFRCTKCNHLGAMLRAEVYPAQPPAPPKPIALPDPALKAALDRLVTAAEAQALTARSKGELIADIALIAPFLGLHPSRELRLAIEVEQWPQRRKWMLQILQHVERTLPRAIR